MNSGNDLSHLSHLCDLSSIPTALRLSLGFFFFQVGCLRRRGCHARAGRCEVGIWWLIGNPGCVRAHMDCFSVSSTCLSLGWHDLLWTVQQRAPPEVRQGGSTCIVCYTSIFQHHQFHQYHQYFQSHQHNQYHQYHPYHQHHLYRHYHY